VSEGYNHVPAGKVWYRVIGEGDETPLLCLYGGPGATRHVVEELVQIRAAIELDRLHLFGSSRKGLLAMQYVLDRRAELQSLILCGSPRQAAGFTTTCPEYMAATMSFYRERMRRLKPWPAGLEPAFTATLKITI